MLKTKLLNNRNKYIIVSAILLLGVIIGAVYGSHNAITDNGYFANFISAYKLHGASSRDTFIRAILSNLRPIALIWISGWFLLLIPLNFIQIVSKGFGLGYTVAYLISVSGFKGFLFSFSSLFIQNLIFIPVLILLSVYELNFAIAFSAKNSGIKQRRKMTANNFITFIFAIILVLILSLIDAHIVPIFIKIICNNMM